MGIQTSTSVIDFVLKQQSVVIYDFTEHTINLRKLLNDICVCYFGIHASQIQTIVIDKTMVEIMQKFHGLNLQEIEQAFKNSKIERTVTITVNQLIDPIVEYVKLKSNIYSQKQKLIDKQNSAEINENEIETTTVNNYNSCVEKGLWDGSIFVCERLAEKLKHKFTTEQKTEWWEKVKTINIYTEDPNLYLQNLGKFLDKKEIDKLPQDKQAERIKTVYVRLMAEKIVKEGIKNKFKLMAVLK